MKLFPVLVLTTLLSACVSAPQSTNNPVPQPWPEALCVIESPRVREGFVNTLSKALQAKGFEIEMVKENSPVDACPWTVTYTGNWRWDLALYMETAQIVVYKEGWPSGEVYYHGGYGLDKFVDAEEKILELVNQLFPETPPSSSKEGSTQVN